MKQVLGVLLLALFVASADVSPSQAQFTKRLKERAKDRIEQRVGEKQDKVIDEVFEEDKTQQTAPTSSADGTGSSAAPSDAAATGNSATAKVGEGVWVNYDFVPGERILYANDFGADRVGDFPRRLEFVNGNMEVAEWQGRRWLRGTSRSGFDIVLDEPLPERFTMEFDFHGVSGSAPYLTVIFEGVSDLSRTEKDMIMYRMYDAGVFAGNHSTKATSEVATDEPFRARIMGDGKYIKVYVNEIRVANIPNADLGRSDRIRIAALGTPERPFMLADLRVAAGGRELYEALEDDGRVATQGILFDTGSATVRPESTPTLTEIALVLKEHPELRLAIEGHTDSVGNADANKSLSQQRAEAVKAALVGTFAVEADRLQAIGHGQEKPAASNDTNEGRQMNRRVELVKL